MSQEAFIICDNLVKIYKVADLEVVALQGLDLVVEPGELLGIVGASGSGKTSLLNILGGLDRPSAGRVWVAGNDLLKMSDSALNRYRRNEVGFVWQQAARNLIPYLNAQENVQLPLTLSGYAGRSKSKRAEELLDIVGLADRRKHRLEHLSGGEQQRVAIAVALANNPKLLLADEPTGEVDSATALTIYDTFKTLTTDFGVTTLIISHDPDLARYVERVVAIRDGQTAAETRRQSSNSQANGSDTADDSQLEEEDVFHELVVLDSAGRLQVPKDYLEQFNIKGRVELDVTDDGILIKPVDVPEADSAVDASASVDELVAASEANKGFRGLINRWRRRGKDE